MNNRRGFTIVELVVAMVLLGALSAIAVPRYREYKRRAYVAAMQSDLGHLRIAEEEHWAEFNQYATDTASLGFRTTSNVRIRIASTDVIGGYVATATHVLAPGTECTTAMGRDAGNLEAGSIHCGPAAAGSGTLSNTP